MMLISEDMEVGYDENFSNNNGVDAGSWAKSTVREDDFIFYVTKNIFPMYEPT